MTTAPPMSDQIVKEAEESLALLDEIREQGRRVQVPGAIWLRAARSCWIIGNEQWSRDFYKNAAPALLDTALDTGRKIGAFETYAGLAMGAAWMSQDRDTIVDVCRRADSYAEHQINNVDNPPEPLTRTTLLLTRVRVAWYRGQKLSLQEYLPELERRAAQLDAISKAFWSEERGAVVTNFYRQIFGTSGNARDLITAAVRLVDAHLEKTRAKPPTIMDLVDEEFISFARKLEDLGIFLPKVTTPTVAGEMPAAEEQR